MLVTKKIVISIVSLGIEASQIHRKYYCHVNMLAVFFLLLLKTNLIFCMRSVIFTEY